MFIGFVTVARSTFGAIMALIMGADWITRQLHPTCVGKKGQFSFQSNRFLKSIHTTISSPIEIRSTIDQMSGL